MKIVKEATKEQIEKATEMARAGAKKLLEKGILTVDAPRSVEEILALIRTIPTTAIIHHAKKGSIKQVEKEMIALQKWFDNFVPKLEAFLKDHVSRAQLKKLHKDFPMLDEEEAYPNFTKHDLLLYIGKIGEWRERLERLK